VKISNFKHRSPDTLKEFGTERMPFKRFESNSAFYYTMVVAFFLHKHSSGM